MPIPIAAAGVAASRRAALSAARRKAAKSRGAAKKSKGKMRGAADRRDQIPWIEVLFVALFVGLPNDIVDLIKILPGIGDAIASILEPITFFFLSAWFLWRVNEKLDKKFIKQFFTLIIEFMPIIGILPMWTLLVINVKTGWLDQLFKIPLRIFKI